MLETPDKHIINDGLYLYKLKHSSRWFARFKIAGKWMARTTKERELGDAIQQAYSIKAEFETLFKYGHAIQTKAFKDVAQRAIVRMRAVPKGAKGHASMLDYEHILNKYHIPFFDRTHVTSIDYNKLAEFDQWRAKKLGKNPAQSTLKSHNAALQRVFDEAVNNKWMTKSQVPSLTTSQGSTNLRRSHFTHEEINKILEAFPGWIANSRKEITSDIRKLLYYYVQIALNTGMRPGKELDQLTVNDIEDKFNHIIFKVRKGKTTLYTGTRKVVGHDKVKDIVSDLIEWNNLKDDSKPLFLLPSGLPTKELSRNFTALLKEIDLYDSLDGARSLYCLRHSYITFKLEEKMDPYALAKQCGNSIEIIQRFYGHVQASDFADDLIKETSKISKLIHQYNAEIVDFGDE
jgi:integrase